MSTQGSKLLARSFANEVTLRSVVTGLVMAALMCAVNSYLTLKAGIIEEGPIISALVFISLFSALRQRVSATEAVLVATMGSAGGSFGFVANIFTAYKMIGVELSTAQMLSLTLCTGAMSVLMAIPFYQLFVVKERLKWPVGQACADVIKSTVEEEEHQQSRVILVFSVIFFLFVLAQGGYPVLETLKLFSAGGLTSIGLGLSPFLIGAGYLVGIRVSIGFAAAALIQIFLAPYTDNPAAPHRFVYPGVAFLLASGLTSLLINWRMMANAILSLRNLGTSDENKIMSGKTLIISLATAAIFTIAVLKWFFSVPLFLSIILVAIGSLFLNLIAVRAMGETTFNPIRIMGVLLQGITALLGPNTAPINMSGAGVLAGSANQSGILVQDLFTGSVLNVRPRIQMALQIVVLPVIAVISVFVFKIIANTYHISINSDALAAPVAKMWAAICLILTGGQLPDNAVPMMIGFGIAGILAACLDSTRLKKYLPHPTGLGIGLILSIPNCLAFTFGAIVFTALNRYFKMSEVTLNSICASAILGEGVGGILSGVLKSMGVFPM